MPPPQLDGPAPSTQPKSELPDNRRTIIALQHSITLDYGITAPEAYARIQSINHTHNELTVTVEWWFNAQARLDLARTIKTHSFSLPWQETVSLPDVYSLLKLEDYFDGAIDV